MRSPIQTGAPARPAPSSPSSPPPPSPPAHRRPPPESRCRARPRLAAPLLAVSALALAPLQAQTGEGAPAASPIRVFASGGLDAEVAALIMSGQEGGTLPLEILALPLVDSDTTRLMLVVEVAGRPLLAGSPASPLRVELFAYLLTPGNIVRSWLLRTLEIDLEAARARLASGGLRLLGAIEVPPGEYSLRVLVRSAQSGDLGSRVERLAVPAPAAGRPLALAALEDTSASRWLDVELTDSPVTAWWTTSPPPPSALPVLSAGQLARVRVAVTGGGPAPGPASVEILERREELVLARLPLPLERAAADPTGQPAVLAGEMPVPDLATGRYRMRVVLPGAGNPPTTTAEIGFLVGDPAAPPLARVWPALDLAPSPPPTADGEVEPGAAAVWSESERTALGSVRRSYHRALERLGAGASSSAVELVSGLESGLLQQHGFRSLAMLRQVELATARRVADRRPEGLLPLCLLHVKLHALYQGRGQDVLHDHSRLIALQMLELYVAATEPDGFAAASGVLTSLGTDLLRGHHFREAEMVLERALAYDGENQTARLGLAAMFEKQGRYGRAVATLQRLIDVRPGHPEALLRLAVNQLRAGQRARGRRRLADLVGGDLPPWVASVAAQELAREHLRQGEMEAAERLLRQARQRLPGHDELSLQLAMLLDLAGRSEDAGAVIAELDRLRQPDRESARRRYNQWPLGLFAAAGREMDAAAEGRLADLGAAVATGPEEPEG